MNKDNPKNFFNIISTGWEGNKTDNYIPSEPVENTNLKSISDITFNSRINNKNIVEKKREIKKPHVLSKKDYKSVLYDNLSLNKQEQKKYVLYKYMLLIFKVLFIEFNIRNKSDGFDMEKNINHIQNVIYPDFMNSLYGYYSLWKKKPSAFSQRTGENLNTSVTFNDFLDKYKIRMLHGIDAVMSGQIPIEKKLTFNRVLAQQLVIKNKQAQLIDNSNYVEDRYPNFISNNVPLPYTSDGTDISFNNVMLERVNYSGDMGNNSLDKSFKKIVEGVDKLVQLINKTKIDLDTSYKYQEFTDKMKMIIADINSYDNNYLTKISKEFNLLNSIHIN